MPINAKGRSKMGGLFVWSTDTVERFALVEMGLVFGAGDYLKPNLGQAYF